MFHNRKDNEWTCKDRGTTDNKSILENDKVKEDALDHIKISYLF